MDAQKLLDLLCQRFGFCLSGEDQLRICADPPTTVDAFTDEVIRAEGLDPLRYDALIRRSMRYVVSEHFGERVWRGRRER